MTGEQFKKIIIYVLIFVLLFVSLRCIGYFKESFVTMPGSIELGACLATCAQDSQCEVALYTDSAKKCAVARDFALPDTDQIAYRKLNMTTTPKTFIRSDTEERVNTTEMGVDGQGLPIDWTLDSNLEHKLTQQETDNLLNERAKEYELDDQQQGFSDLDVVYHPQGNEGARNENHRSRTTKERMTNVNSFDPLDTHASVSDYTIVDSRLGEYSAKTIPNITLPDCLQTCKKNNCSKALYDHDKNICYLRK